MKKKYEKEENRNYIKHKYKYAKDAKEKQRQIKQKFGYTPKIQYAKHKTRKNDEFYFVIEPKDAEPTRTQQPSYNSGIQVKDYWNFTGLTPFHKESKPQSIGNKIQELIDEGYTQAAFSKKSNANKFIEMWKEKDTIKKSVIRRTTGPTIEEPNKKVKAYYVMIDLK